MLTCIKIHLVLFWLVYIFWNVFHTFIITSRYTYYINNFIVIQLIICLLNYLFLIYYRRYLINWHKSFYDIENNSIWESLIAAYSFSAFFFPIEENVFCDLVSNIYFEDLVEMKPLYKPWKILKYPINLLMV